MYIKEANEEDQNVVIKKVFLMQDFSFEFTLVSDL